MLNSLYLAVKLKDEDEVSREESIKEIKEREDMNDASNKYNRFAIGFVAVGVAALVAYKYFKK